MQSTLFASMAIATGGILSPGAMLLTLLLLASPSGLKKALALYLGYFGAYSTIGVVTVWVSHRVQSTQPTPEGPDTFTGWASLAIGSLMLSLALRTWRRPPRDAAERPKIFDAIDKMAPLKIFVFGAVVPCINMKNLSIFLSAIAIVVEARLPREQAAVIAVLTAFVLCLAVLGPIVVYAVGRARAKPLLARLRERLERGARSIMLTVLTVFGTVMLARGLYKLLG